MDHGKQNGRTSRIAPEVAIAGVAIAVIAVGLSQPAVMSLAGLDISKQRAVGRSTDPTPVAVIKKTPAAAPSPEAPVHGLAGIVKGLRSRD